MVRPSVERVAHRHTLSPPPRGTRGPARGRVRLPPPGKRDGERARRRRGGVPCHHCSVFLARLQGRPTLFYPSPPPRRRTGRPTSTPAGACRWVRKKTSAGRPRRVGESVRGQREARPEPDGV